MKRKHTLTALLIVVMMLAVSMLTGCAPKLPTAEDAQNYTKAVLDLMCTGDYDHNVKLADVEEGKELEMRDAMIDDALQSIAGDAGLTDDVTAEFKDVLIEAFAKCKYTVGEAVQTGDGEYDVTVSIEPLKLFAGVQGKLMEQSETLFDDVEDPRIPHMMRLRRSLFTTDFWIKNRISTVSVKMTDPSSARFFSQLLLSNGSALSGPH